MLGRSKCEVLSCVDLKDTFYSLGLTDKARELCGILPYFGSTHYRYEVLPMGLSISPQVWITYIENILEGIPNRQFYITIMDDHLPHSLKSDHMVLFEHLLKVLITHGLKLSPRIVYNQTPVRKQMVNKTPISAAQAVSRKLVQKSVKLLNTPRSRSSSTTSTDTMPPVKLFPSNDTTNSTGNESLIIRQLKVPFPPVPKLPSQQALLPQKILLILTQWFSHAYGIHVTTASPTNHQSLMVEHGIKILANILIKHLTGLSENWPLYCKPAMLVYNSLQSPTKNAPGTPNETALEERIVETH